MSESGSVNTIRFLRRMNLIVYLCFQTLTLGYNLPTDVLNRAKIAKLRLYVSTNNLFTITGYDGLDPSVGGAADTNFGIDVGNYPITRSFTAGVNLGF